MKKQTTRRKMLISSVAMLLVAMVALGTATFAWFTTNTTATADKLSVKTTSASELQVSSASVDWTDQLHYGYVDEVLKPASSADGTNWFAANAAAKDSYAADSNTITALDALSSYVIADQLNVRNNGGADVENVKITFKITETEANSGKYFRLALVPVSAKGGSSGEPTATNFANNVYAVGADSADALTSTAGATTTVFATDASSTVTVNVGTLIGSNSSSTTGSKVAYYNLYVWFEGQDEDCYDSNAGNAVPEITFTVTGDTVTS